MPASLPADLLRKSRLAAGVALICGLAVAETVVAHHAQPNPLSVWVWALLGSAGAAALVASLWFRQLWQQALGAAPTVSAQAPAAPPAAAPEAAKPL